jgi:formate dehydrogenase major subunit
MLAELLLKWPLIRQLKSGADGTGAEAMSERTRTLQPRNAGAEVARSICPYCGVGCGQLVYHRDGQVISIEGDPESPISRGHLCPKGAASFELVTHEARATTVKYRAPFAPDWREIPLEEAMDMIASQMPADLKRARADWVIENVGSMEDLEREVDRLWEALAKDNATSLSGSNVP